MRQPIATVTLTRPWYWGAVIITDPEHGADLPGDAPYAPVVANDSAVIISVRHAQDIEDDSGDPPRLTEATITLTAWQDRTPEAADRGNLMFDGVLVTPSAVLSVGDAEHELLVPAFAPTTRVRICGNDEGFGSSLVQIDISPE